ncbi:hypothetical protein HDU67_001550, partial [Dinochytrium kinnereticum]
MKSVLELQNVAKGIRIDGEASDAICEGCLEGKLTRTSHQSKTTLVTVRLSVYNRIGTNAGIEEDAGITIRGAHGHTRKLLGLVPRLPISFHGLTYYVQAFIIDDRIDPKPPFGLLLGQPFLELARAETFWTDNGDQWTRFRSQQNRDVCLKIKTVDARDKDI